MAMPRSQNARSRSRRKAQAFESTTVVGLRRLVVRGPSPKRYPRKERGWALSVLDYAARKDVVPIARQLAIKDTQPEAKNCLYERTGGRERKLLAATHSGGVDE